MAYQVLARKYRPQRFDDIVGQRGVTQTLRNAIGADRIAQAFVFAGPRGVGKTTTARVLARALNCESGPTAEPCGTCNACVEIAEGRDIDVMEIDAATHTQVENVREVIIAGLAMAPVRNRYKIFIIDEFHQLSSHSFNALLKSIEEPPPHVVFMMATTELQKIPDTILSRSQVFEFRTIGTRAIGAQLREIAAKESIAIDDAGVALIARAADGSMRDAQSALDQVMAFAGDTITAEEVSTVLGLIGRDPVLDAVEVVADENAPAVFELAGRFVEAGYDLRLVCRELTRALRDMLVISIDQSRAQDPDVATDADRDRLVALASRFSREDLLRAFDVLSRAEFEIRGAAQPRHHLEMALLKWMHLRKLVPLTELLEGGAARSERPAVAPPPRPAARPLPARGEAAQPGRPAQPREAASPAPPRPQVSREPAAAAPATASAPTAAEDGKAAILAEIKRRKKFFHGTVVAQAQRIDLAGDRLTFMFAAGQRTLAAQIEQSREWLEEMATEVAGRKLTVAAVRAGADPPPDPPPPPAAATDGAEDLREEVLGNQVVQAMLDVLGAEIRDVEKIKP
ncbi:MAG: DNA polymerase III subunit gamma/tau [Acidobacteria bacterium]|nr:DNA polymerase III subunit gamma/tau [Acidobacteriota bacterium]